MNPKNQYFNLERILQLYKIDFIRGWKEFVITLSAICGFFLIIFMIASKTGGIEPSIHSGYFGILLFVGLISTSRAFKPAHRKLQNHEWLMLPASTFEKLLEKLLLHTIFYSALALIFYTVFSLISYVIVHFILGSYFPLFNPVSSEILKMIGYYCLIQSVFFLGASWFKNKNFLKTILSIAIFWFILGTITMIAGLLIFRADFWAVANSNGFHQFNYSYNLNSENLVNYVNILAVSAKILFFGLMAPICWFGSWLKLKEVEVKDGV